MYNTYTVVDSDLHQCQPGLCQYLSVIEKALWSLAGDIVTNDTAMSEVLLIMDQRWQEMHM